MWEMQRSGTEQRWLSTDADFSQRDGAGLIERSQRLPAGKDWPQEESGCHWLFRGRFTHVPCWGFSLQLPAFVRCHSSSHQSEHVRPYNRPFSPRSRSPSLPAADRVRPPAFAKEGPEGTGMVGAQHTCPRHAVRHIPMSAAGGTVQQRVGRGQRGVCRKRCVVVVVAVQVV